jgi:hypothetical protein
MRLAISLAASILSRIAGSTQSSTYKSTQIAVGIRAKLLASGWLPRILSSLIFSGAKLTPRRADRRRVAGLVAGRD